MKNYMLLALATGFLGGCVPIPIPGLGGGTGDQTGPPGLQKFSSQEELLQYLRDQARPRANDFMGGMPMGPFGGFVALGAEAAPAGVRNDAGPDAVGGNEDQGFSGTNLQEPGVDESDVVKTDGHYLYVLSRGTLRIVSVDEPEAMAETARLDLPGRPDSMFLRGDLLVALTTSGGYYQVDDGFGRPGIVEPAVLKDDGSSDPDVGVAPPPDEWLPDRAKVSVHLIDVADRTAPQITHSFEFEGFLNAARMIQSKLHVIVNIEPSLPYDITPQQIDALALSDWLPDYRETAAGAAVSSGDVVGWADVYRPTNPNGYGMTGVVTLDVDNPEAGFKAVAVVADAGTVYASTKALYITDTQYGWHGMATRTTTAIHKLDLTGEGAVYVASGRVNGRLLNQFSLSEYEDHLRVATTSPAEAVGNQFWMGPMGIIGPPTTRTSNNVYVLGVEDGRLNVTGKIEDIAPGEEIYAARFLGRRGFLVTFIRVDPLFTIDLSDPNNPQLVGKLKVPGYSDYIHPLDENHLLTIGKDADETSGLYQGVQLSVFDVTDFANPTLLHKELIGTRGTESEALYDHKAFTYYAPKDLLAIPIDLAEGDGQTPWDYGRYTFSGLYVYKITVADGFSLLGRIGTRTNSEYGWWWPDTTFTRGVVIADSIYAITEDGVRGAPIADEIPGAAWTLDFQQN